MRTTPQQQPERAGTGGQTQTDNPFILRSLAGAPVNSFIHVPDTAKLVGVAKRNDNSFEYQSVYALDGERLTEGEMLRRGLASFRVNLGRYSIRDFTIL